MHQSRGETLDDILAFRRRVNYGVCLVTLVVARAGNSCVQKAHRLALSGMLLRQNGHSRVVTATGVSVFARLISTLTGRTTKKKTTAAIIRNDATALMKSPIKKRLRLIVKAIEEKSGLPPIAAINGVIRSLTRAVTTAPKAAPITMPTAKSTTLPRSTKALKSLPICRILSPFRAMTLPLPWWLTTYSTGCNDSARERDSATCEARRDFDKHLAP